MYASAKPGQGDGHADTAASGKMEMDVLGHEDGSRVLLRGWWRGWEWDVGMQAASLQWAGTSQLAFAAPKNVVQGGKRVMGSGKGFGLNWFPRWSRSDSCKRWEPRLNPSKVFAPGDVGCHERG